MATAKQSEVTWVKKGDMVNGKKATRGYLALKSDKGKAFSGTVTGVAKGTTTTRNNTAQYSGGRNVYKVAERRSAAKSGGTVSTSSSSSYAKPSKPKGTYPSYLVGKTGSSAAVTSATKPAGRAKSPTPPVGRGAGGAATARPSAVQAQIQRVTNQINAKRKEIDLRAKKASKTTADAQALQRDRNALAALQKTLNSLK
jgi:hypothetical protein